MNALEGGSYACAGRRGLSALGRLERHSKVMSNKGVGFNNRWGMWSRFGIDTARNLQLPDERVTRLI